MAKEPCMKKSGIRFSRDASVVVIGAHPDDAVRACGGVMLRALAKGAGLTVIAVTDGAALFGKEGIPEGRETAAGRRAEQVRALRVLGVPRRDTLYLGFPDGGIAKLRHRHRGHRSRPYFCPWLDADHTGDMSCVPGIGFSGNTLLNLLTDRIAHARPTHLFTHASGDRHPDHRGVTWFVRRALARLRRTACSAGSCTPGRRPLTPAVYEYLTYLRGTHWPPAGSAVPVDAARALPFPGRVVDFRLTPAEQRRKDAALDRFTPILGDAYIDNWRRTNEIYWIAE